MLGWFTSPDATQRPSTTEPPQLLRPPVMRRAAAQTMLLAAVAFGVSTYLPLNAAPVVRARYAFVIMFGYAILGSVLATIRVNHQPYRFRCPAADVAGLRCYASSGVSCVASRLPDGGVRHHQAAAVGDVQAGHRDGRQ